MMAEGVDPFTDGSALHATTEILESNREAWQGEEPSHGEFSIQIGYPFSKYGWTQLQLPHWLLMLLSVLFLVPVMVRYILGRRIVAEQDAALKEQE